MFHKIQKKLSASPLIASVYNNVNLKVSSTCEGRLASCILPAVDDGGDRQSAMYCTAVTLFTGHVMEAF